MRALRLEKHPMMVNNQDRPIPSPDEALIRISLAGICATDLEIINGYKHFHGIMGHECVGVVEACSDPYWIGQRVVSEINCGCQTCAWCRKKEEAHCQKRTVPGILGHNGVFADYCCMPTHNLHRVPEGVSDRMAVFTEPLAAALEITQKIHIPPSHRVVVIGDGRLGLLVAQVLNLTGCELLVIGRHPNKWSLLKDQGIHTCLISDIKSGFKANTVVECSGQQEGFKLARQLVQSRGHIILKSTFRGAYPIDMSSLVVDEIRITGSRCGPFAPALRLLERRLIHVEPMIHKVYPLDQGLQALHHAGQKGVLKILIQPGL